MGKSANPLPHVAPECQGLASERLLLFIHNNQWGTVAEYVIYFLKQVRGLFTKIIFISNTPLSEDARIPLHGLYDIFYPRVNSGCAFHAWKEALTCLGQDRLSAYGSVTLMTDKCFGALFDLEKVYRHMYAKKVDFWGITRAQQAEGDIRHVKKNESDPAAIESYFLCFHQVAVRTDTFRAFWENVGTENDTYSQTDYETRLAETLHQAGLKSAVLCDISRSDHKVVAKSIIEPEIILEQHIPLLKLNSFFCGTPPENSYLLTLIREQSNYPVTIIHDYLSRYFQPEVSLKVIGHCLEEKKRNIGKRITPQRIALHIHAFYIDIFCQILHKIRHSIKMPIDIFITTDSEIKADQIRHLMRNDFPQLQVCTLLVCENRGRDIWPWLLVAPMMEDYDFAGHLHTKKSPTASARFSIQWREELLDCLLGRFGLIEAAFASRPQLGIVIPDIPNVFKFPPYHYDYHSDFIGKHLLAKTWKQLALKRSIDFSTMRMLVFPYGNMFWYRPEALSPFWQRQWAIGKIPKEPVPIHGTLLHALERLPVYVSWSLGYDFQIAPSTSLCATGFQSEYAMSVYSKNKSSMNSPADQKKNMLQMLHNKIRQRLAMPKE